MSGNIYGFVILFMISIGVALIVYALTRRSLRHLLDDVIKLPSGTSFYLRLFSIGLFFIAFSASLEIKFDLKADASFMEYVWKIAIGLSTVFGNTCLFIIGYLTLITVLLAVLKYKNV